MKATLLVVEDDAATRQVLAAALEDCNYLVTAVDSGEAAIAFVEERPFSAVICDLKLGEVSGMEVVAHIGRTRPDTVVIVVTGHGTVETAVQAVRGGAWDFLTKPVDLDRLEASLLSGLTQQALVAENRALKARLRDRFSLGGIIGRSRALMRVLEDVERFAATDANVLVTGESGVGKELAVEALHLHSARADHALIQVNCPALAAGVLESELFGHEKGAFTGAVRARRGRFEAAHGGTLFLDEIAEIDVGVQAKLLRAIEQQTVERVGSSQSVQVDVRIVAATNRDLEAEVGAGRFREDLFYRLAVLRIRIPPLRERREDIPLLVDHFVHHFADKHGLPVRGVSPGAMSALGDYAWPGNVRELRNTIESGVVLCRGTRLTCSDLPVHAARGQVREVAIPVGSRLDDAERALIMATLQSVGGNKAEAARILGIGLRTLFRRIDSWKQEQG